MMTLSFFQCLVFLEAIVPPAAVANEGNGRDVAKNGRKKAFLLLVRVLCVCLCFLRLFGRFNRQWKVRKIGKFQTER